MVNHSLNEIVKGLNDNSEYVLFLSKNNTFKDNKKVITFKDTSDSDLCVGKLISAIFIDKTCSSFYNLKTLDYLLTRIRGEGSKKFPNKIYFVSDYDDRGNYTFFGDVNV